jgi:TolB-like protein/Tfp pilus assembly protein PilF
MSLMTELKRRNVFRVGVAYAIVSWLLVEVASVVLPTFGAPEWVMKVFTFLVTLGFPLALILAWAFELTPEGIKREAEVDRTGSITRVTGRKFDFAIIGLLVLAVVFLIVDNYVLETDPDQAEVATERVLGGVEVAHEASIAVLPFANRSANEADAFFVDGIHDDILTHLAKIRSLKVISRTSVMEYRNTTKNLKTIGQELGAATVLEGGVQRAGNQIRVNVQLIDAQTDDHLWAEIYDRKLTVENIFAIQTEIAMAIADALQATLSPEEQDQLAALPTKNLAAYEAYLFGKQRLAKEAPAAMEEAIVYFQQAIDLDPSFALGYVGLAESYILRFFYSDRSNDEMLVKAQSAAGKALELDDRLGEAYNSLAGIKEERGDLEGAEAAYQRAIELNPNYSMTYSWYGWLLREKMGRAEEALALHMRAAELDPMSADLRTNVADDLMALGRVEESLAWNEKALEVDPEFSNAYGNIGQHYYFVLGQLDEAISWIARGHSIDSGRPGFPAVMGLIFLDLGDFDMAEFWIRRSSQLRRDSEASSHARQVMHLYREDQSSLDDARKAIANFPNMWSAAAILRNHELREGRTAEARATYERIRPELLSEADPRIDDDNFRIAIDLALVLFRTGERERADLLLDRSLEYIQTIPRVGDFGIEIAAVQIYALRSDKQKALSALRQAIDEGWRNLWWYYLKQDPSLESLHDEPEYQAMVAEIEADMAAQLTRVREMERNGELEPIPEVSATAQ